LSIRQGRFGICRAQEFSRDHPFPRVSLVSILRFGITAQTTTSTIEGTVTDPNGAVIAGATVKASGTTLAIERSATTDAEGSTASPLCRPERTP
jgi:hypothetical protein